MNNAQQLRERRDAKVIPHLTQYAPVWLMDEVLIEEDQAVQFSVVFQHNLYGWVNRRYRYDGFNDVLYHKGQIAIVDADALVIQQQEPYISTTVADVPNAYGG